MSELKDVDATWDGTGSLDEHRQKAFAELQQPGFGAKSDSAKAKRAAKQSPPEAAEESRPE